MTEENHTPEYGYQDIERYRGINLAKKFAKEGDMNQLEKSLTSFGENLGMDAKDAETAAKAQMNSPQAIDGYIKAFEGNYQEAMSSTKVGDFLNGKHATKLEKLMDEETLEKAKSHLNEYADMEYGEANYKLNMVQQEIQKYKTMLESNYVSDEEKEEMRGDIERIQEEQLKYARIVQPIRDAEQEYLKDLESPVNQEAKREEYKQLYSDNPGQ